MYIYVHCSKNRVLCRVQVNSKIEISIKMLFVTHLAHIVYWALMHQGNNASYSRLLVIRDKLKFTKTDNKLNNKISQQLQINTC